MAGNEACVDACVTVVKEIIEGGSTAVFNEIARGGQGFGRRRVGTTARRVVRGGGVAYGAPNDAATYAQQQAMYAQMYAQMGYTPDFERSRTRRRPSRRRVPSAIPTPSAPIRGARSTTGRETSITTTPSRAYLSGRNRTGSRSRITRRPDLMI